MKLLGFFSVGKNYFRAKIKCIFKNNSYIISVCFWSKTEFVNLEFRDAPPCHLEWLGWYRLSFFCTHFRNFLVDVTSRLNLLWFNLFKSKIRPQDLQTSNVRIFQQCLERISEDSPIIPKKFIVFFFLKFQNRLLRRIPCLLFSHHVNNRVFGGKNLIARAVSQSEHSEFER